MVFSLILLRAQADAPARDVSTVILLMTE